jgi:hypothetical protein
MRLKIAAIRTNTSCDKRWCRLTFSLNLFRNGCYNIGRHSIVVFSWAGTIGIVWHAHIVAGRVRRLRLLCSGRRRWWWDTRSAMGGIRYISRLSGVFTCRSRISRYVPVGIIRVVGLVGLIIIRPSIASQPTTISVKIGHLHGSRRGYVQRLSPHKARAGEWEQSIHNERWGVC